MNKNNIKIEQEIYGLANSLNLELSWHLDNKEEDDSSGELEFKFTPVTDGGGSTTITVWCVGKEDVIMHLHDLAAKLHQAADALAVG